MPLGIDRQTILIGPGYIAYNNKQFLAADDITIRIPRTLFEVQTNGYGAISARKEDFQLEVSCTPLHWDNLADLFPYASAQIGTSIYGSADKPLTIHPRNGANSGIILANAAVTKMSDIILSAIKPALSGMTFTGLLANNSDPSLVSSYYSVGTVGSQFPTPDLSKIPNSIYTANWGTALANMAAAVEGPFTFSPSLSIEDVKADGYGTIDKIVSGLGCSVKCTPRNVTWQQVLATLAGEAIGAEPASNSFIVAGNAVGSPKITLAKTVVEQGEGRWGNNQQRLGELTFRTIRTATAGALTPLWTITSVTA